MSTCTHPGCDRPAMGKGLCATHYGRKRRADLAALTPEERAERAALAAERAALREESYLPNLALAELCTRLEAKRDELIAAGADDRTKLEKLRAMAREHRAQYQRAPLAEWRRGWEIEQ